MEENTEEKKHSEKNKSRNILLEKKGIIVILAIAIIALLSYMLYTYSPQTNNTEYHYATALGQVWAFRADLREAEKVEVKPTEDAIYFELFSIGEDPFIDNITIAFKDAGLNENGYYILQIQEIVTKMKIIYDLVYSGEKTITFDSLTVDSYDNLPGKIKNPIIAIVHPKFANETSIILEDNHAIILNAKSYQDMDLVATKLLMIALKLERSD